MSEDVLSAAEADRRNCHGFPELLASLPEPPRTPLTEIERIRNLLADLYGEANAERNLRSLLSEWTSRPLILAGLRDLHIGHHGDPRGEEYSVGFHPIG